MSEQKTAFEAWYRTEFSEDISDSTFIYYESCNRYQRPYVDRMWATYQAGRAALQSPEVQALYEALKEVVDAADGEGWGQLDPGLEKQRAALAAMEKRK